MTKNVAVIFGYLHCHKTCNSYVSMSFRHGSQSGLKICTGLSKTSDQIFTQPNASSSSRSKKPEIFMSLYSSVLSQSGPTKSVGEGEGV